MKLFRFEKEAIASIDQALQQKNIIFLVGPRKSGKSTIAEGFDGLSYSDTLLIQGKYDKRYVHLYPFRSEGIRSTRTDSYKLLSRLLNGISNNLIGSSLVKADSCINSIEYATLLKFINQVSEKVIIFDNIEFFDPTSFNIFMELIKHGMVTSQKKFIICVTEELRQEQLSNLLPETSFSEITIPVISNDVISTLLKHTKFNHSEIKELSIGQLIELNDLLNSEDISDPNIFVFLTSRLQEVRSSLKEHSFILDLLFFYGKETNNSFVDISLISDYSNWVYNLPNAYRELLELKEKRVLSFNDDRTGVKLTEVFFHTMENETITFNKFKYNFYSFVNAMNQNTPEQYFRKYLFLQSVDKTNEAVEQGILAYNEFITHGIDPVISNKLRKDLLHLGCQNELVNTTIQAIDAMVNFKYNIAYTLSDRYLAKKERLYIGSIKTMALLSNIKYRAKLRVVTGADQSLTFDQEDINDIDNLVRTLEDSDDTLIINLMETKLLISSQLSNFESIDLHTNLLELFYEVDSKYSHLVTTALIQYKDYWEYRRALFLGKISAVSSSHERNIDVLNQAKQLINSSTNNLNFIVPTIEVSVNLANEYFENTNVKKASQEIAACIEKITSTNSELNWLIVLELQIIFELLSGHEVNARKLLDEYTNSYFSSEIGIQKIHEKLIWQVNLLLLNVVFDKKSTKLALSQISNRLCESSKDSYDKLFLRINRCILFIHEQDFVSAQKELNICNDLCSESVEFFDQEKLALKLQQLHDTIELKDKIVFNFENTHGMYDAPLFFSDIAYWSNYI